MKRTLSVISAPSNLGLMPTAEGQEPGVKRMPEVLISNGLLDGLAVTEVVAVSPPPYGPARDPKTGVRNADAIRAYAVELATAVERSQANGAFLLVLGGDCSVLLGPMLALRRQGDYGLVFIDGHRDFQTPETSATGGAAGMDLALVTGRGPDLLTRFEGFPSLVRDEATVVLGYRDERAAEPDGSGAIDGTEIVRLGLDAVREIGSSRAASEALSLIQASGARGFWLHVDADVLSSDVMPAVDSPQPGGMSYAELQALLVPLVQSDLAVGLEVTIYDPALDPSGAVGLAFAGFVTDTLAKAGYGA